MANLLNSTRSRLLMTVCALGLTTSGCAALEESPTGSMLGFVAGAAGGYSLGSYSEGEDGDGTYALIMAGLGGMAGMMMGASLENGNMTVEDLAQGAVMAAEGAAQAQAEVAAQQAELDRLRIAAEQETAEKQEAEQRARRQAEIEHARRVTEEQFRIAEANAQRSQASNASAEAQRAADADAKRAREEEQRAEAERQRQAERTRIAEERAEAQRKAEAERAEAARIAAEKRRAAEEEANRLVEFVEAVTICELKESDPQSKFGNWRCTGPLQWTYAKMDAPNLPYQISLACGGKSSSVRDLGMSSGYRIFGCSYGIPRGTTYINAKDVAAEFGVYVPGRMTFRCKKTATSCRTQ